MTIEYTMKEDISNKRFKIAYVYRSSISSTNNGFSDMDDKIYIEDKNGNYFGSDINELQAFYIDNYKDTLRIKPYAKKVGLINDMFGGNYAAHNNKMYKILDRCEIG